MKESFKIRNKKTGKFSLGGMKPSWGRDGKTWNGIGPLRLHLRQFNAKNIVDWEVIQFKTTITNAIPAVDLYEIGSKPPEIVQENQENDDSIAAERFRFCLKWGWPKRYCVSNETYKFEFLLSFLPPGEDVKLSVYVCRGNTIEETIDMAIKKIKEVNERIIVR